MGYWRRGAAADYTYEASVQTTDATQTIIDTIPIPTDAAVGLLIVLTGVKSDGSQILHLVAHSSYKNDGGTVTKNPESAFASHAHYERSDTVWTYDENISGTNTRIRVTGKVATTINWKSRVEVYL